MSIVGVHPQDGGGCVRARGRSEVPPQPAAERLIVDERRGERRRGGRPRPHVRSVSSMSRSRSAAIRRPRVVVASERASRSSPSSTSADVRSGNDAANSDAHVASLGVAEQRGPLRAGRVHHGAHVVHPALQGREIVVGHRIGEPGPRLSNRISRENDARRSRNARESRLLPHHLDVRDPARHVDEVERAGAHDLIRDVDAVARGVSGLGNVHGNDGRPAASRSASAVFASRTLPARAASTICPNGIRITSMPSSTSPSGSASVRAQNRWTYSSVNPADA